MGFPRVSLGTRMGADLAAEEQFGPYLVYERLGVGGMATVHRALERGFEGFERVVALKRLLPHLAEDASFIKSFVREAKLASLLNHHNIVQIYELGRVGTEYFISMEHIDGRDIRRILRHSRKVSGPPPIDVTVGLMLQLCDALDYAHNRVDDDGHPLNIVHRDISPSNLIITNAGHLKVIDFGIARAQSSQLRTQTGRVKGKLAYMSPEAIGGRELDARSDLWAAGVIAHELLTARPLFARKNEYDTLVKVQREDIALPSQYNPDVPPELDAIVMKALTRDPAERYPDASSFREALLAFRLQKKLLTGHRDVASWLTWAFSLDEAAVEAGGTGPSERFDLAAAAQSLAGLSGSSLHLTPTPRPLQEDDEAVEIAWGGGGEGSHPVELDDVPDVSEKFARPLPSTTTGDHDADDIPAPTPSHGVPRRRRRSTAQGVSAAAPLPRRGTTQGHAHGSRPLPLPAPTEIPDETTERSSADEIPAAAARHARALSEASAELPSDISGARFDRVESTGEAPVRSREPSSPPSAATVVSTGGLERLTGPTQADPDALVATQPRRARQASNIMIGASIVERESVRSRAWVWLLALVVIAGGGIAIALYMSRDHDSSRDAAASATPSKPAPEKPVTALPPQGTVKFEVEPTDVTIHVEDETHTGSPWSIKLAPGVHKIELRRDGYKTRLATIELSPNETMTMLVALDRAPHKAGTHEMANLILRTSPPGMEVMIDGRVLHTHTPIHRPIRVGWHTIAIRQDGVVVWSQHLLAEANAEHEFSPVFTEQKKRERKKRLERERTIVKPASVPETPTPDEATKPDEPEPAPVVPQPVATVPIAPPIPKLPTPAPKPKPRVIPHHGPFTVAPTAVHRIHGSPPRLGTSRPEDVPPVIAARVCIDPKGAVTDVHILSKLERRASADLASSIREWRYAPYKHDGAAAPACFAVSFRVR